jgi:hypothetical protein
MRNQQRRGSSFKDNLGMLPQVPLLYLQFIKYQPSIIGRVIALIPAALLLLAIALLFI